MAGPTLGSSLRLLSFLIRWALHTSAAPIDWSENRPSDSASQVAIGQVFRWAPQTGFNVALFPVAG